MDNYYEEPEEGTLECIMQNVDSDLNHSSNMIRRIQKVCTNQLSQIDEAAGRMSPRTVGKLDSKTCSELVSCLLDCVSNLRQCLLTTILATKSTFSEILACNEYLKLSLVASALSNLMIPLYL